MTEYLWGGTLVFGACCVLLILEDHVLPAIHEWRDRRWLRRQNAHSPITPEHRTVEPRTDTQAPVRPAGSRTGLPATSGHPGGFPETPGWPPTSVDAPARRQVASTGPQGVRHG